jgi:hypothetical protein
MMAKAKIITTNILENNMSEDFTFSFDDVDNDLDFNEESTTLAVEPEVQEEEKEPVQEAEVEEDHTERNNEYLVIYDSIMFEDKFEKRYKLGKKYSAVFSTRSTDADLKISRQLDGMDFGTMHALQTMSAVLTMSHSLVQLNDKDLSTMSVVERYNFIRTKSSHLIEVLSKHMIEFDGLVRAALEYGKENF